MDPAEIQRLIEQKTMDRGQRTAQLPSMYRGTTYTQDPEYQQNRAQHDEAIKNLYEHDKLIAQQYSQPGSDLYMEDPYQRELARSAQYQATAGQVLDLNNAAESIKTRATQGNDDAMKLWQMTMQSDDSQLNNLQQLLANSIKMQDLAQTKKEKEDAQKSLQAFLLALKNVKNNTNTRGADPQSQVNDLLSVLGVTNPEMFSQGQNLAALQFPEGKDQNFGYTADEYAAGVQGQPRTPQAEAAYSRYQQNKNLQLVSDSPTFALGPLKLGGGKYYIDKQTGQRFNVGENGLPVTGNTGAPSGGSNTSGIVTKLSAAGYSPQQIQEYLQVKGLQ